MWHVSSRSGVATLRTAIHLLLTYFLTYLLIPLRLAGLGESISSLSGSGRSAATKRSLVHFSHKFAPFRLLNDE